ncbi:MAG: 3-isopropylmalate dehydratase large subunit [Steroidobacteraceae bacterium]
MAEMSHRPAIARTLFEKIWRQHVIAADEDGPTVLAVDRIFLHERTGAVALMSLAERGYPVIDPARVFCTMDHIVDTLPGRGDDTKTPGGSNFIVSTRAAAHAAGIRLFDVRDPDQGIVHVVSPELGIVLPGATVVCPDSHTCTQGALGALAWGIGSSDAEEALATGALRIRRPKTLRVTFDGRLSPGVTAKDLSLTLISRYGSAGGNGYVVEYAGAAVRELDVEARLTLCNMTTEFSAMTGLVAPDAKTFAYVEGRRYAPTGACWDSAMAHWQTLRTDEAATFDRQIDIDVTGVAPMITWGTNPAHAVAVTDNVPGFEASGTSREAYDRALHYMGLQPGTPLADLKIDAAFIGSCTNSRLSDLRRAAAVLDGRRVAPGVKAICVPGSSAVKRQAETEGLDRIFRAAGFEWRESGCSMCFYAGGESFGLRQRVISSTNRNFESRQGPQTRTHIASPETVAASAVAGHVADARNLFR